MRIADFNAKQKDGWTAIMFAGYYKHLDTVRLLQDYSAKFQA